MGHSDPWGGGANKTFRSYRYFTVKPLNAIFYFNWFFAAVFVYFNRLKKHLLRFQWKVIALPWCTMWSICS
jgi:hypothetical protein